MRTSFIYLFVLAIVSIQVKGQEGKDANTLFGNKSMVKKSDLGFFLAPMLGFTKMDDASTMLLHVRGGLNVKDKWSVGGYFSTSVNEIKPKSEVLPNLYMDYRSFGGFVEYTLMSKKLIHLSFPIFIGYSEIEMDNEFGSARLGEANFIQIEPSAMLEMNLHKHVRFNVGAGYRIAGNLSYRNISQQDVSGMTGYIGFKFGLFK
jgi:hypothetical protein